MSATVACPRCGTRYPTARLDTCVRCLLAEEEAPPAVLGGAVEVGEEIGRGGMGVVYRGRHRRLERTVAVKVLAPALAEDPEFEERFLREARALARLAHPGIVAVHDCGQEDGYSYIVMEHVAGEPLSRRLPLPLPEARAVALQVAEALGFAHAQGIVHRDVKPDNILLDANGQVKVTDFGLARLLDPEDGLTRAGQALGTPRYMAPEVLAGAPPDPRQDVFALGVVIYETVMGRPPVGDFDPLPGGLDPIVRRALAPDPQRRPRDAGEVARALRALEAEDADLPEGERDWLRAGALVLTLATAAVLWALVSSVTPRVITPGQVEPLIMLRTERLPDGRLVSRARFETGPTLLALATVVVALLTHGLLRRHWRASGLLQRTPERPLREPRVVMALGVAALALYLVRRTLDAQGAWWPSVYVPILGGFIELAALFFTWMSILQAWRTARPLPREPKLWLGMALALVPPALDLTLYLFRWRP